MPDRVTMDVSVPAVRRPAELRIMLESMRRELIDPATPGVRLVVNLDPVGDGSDVEIEEVLKELGGEYLINRPGRASLNAAIVYLWSTVRTDPFLHVEDDVEWRRPIDLPAMLAEFEAHERLAYLAIPRRGFRAGDITSDRLLSHTDSGGAVHWRGGPYRLSFGPGLLRLGFARRAAELLAPHPDPEVQFHLGNEALETYADGWRYATFAAAGDGPAVRDIGRPCREARWRKVVKSTGTTWERRA